MADPQTADQGFLAGLLGKFGADPAAAYGGLLSDPATQRQFALRSLGAAAQAFGQGAMPVPYKGGIPFGATLGAAGGAASTAGDELIKARLEQAQSEQAVQNAAALHAKQLATTEILRNYQDPSSIYNRGGVPGTGTGTGTDGKPLTGPAKIIAGGGGKAISSTTADTSLPPEARALLDTIAGPESNGAYNVRWGGPSGDKTFDSYAAHPNIPEPGPQGDSTAAGRYQIVNKTWKPLQAKYGFGDFTPVTQDQAGWHLAADTYKEQTGRDLLTDLQAGKTDQVTSALHGQWSTLNMGSYGKNLGKYQGGSGASPQTASTGDQPAAAPGSQVGPYAPVPGQPGPQGVYVPPGASPNAPPVRIEGGPPAPAAPPGGLLKLPDPTSAAPPQLLTPPAAGAPGPAAAAASPTLGLLGGGEVGSPLGAGSPQIAGIPRGLLAQVAGPGAADPSAAPAAVTQQAIPHTGAAGAAELAGLLAQQPAPAGPATATPYTNAPPANGQGAPAPGPAPGPAPPAPPSAPGGAAPPMPQPQPVTPSAIPGAPSAQDVRDANRAVILHGIAGIPLPPNINEIAKFPMVGPTAQATAASTAAGQQPYQLQQAANKAMWDIYVAQQKPRDPQREGSFTFNPQTGQYTLNRSVVEADGSTHQHISILDQNLKPLSDYDAGPTKASPGAVATATAAGTATGSVQPISVSNQVTGTGPGYTTPFKTADGSFLPPASSAAPIAGTKDYLDTRSKQFADTEDNWGKSVGSAQEAMQRTQAIMTAMKLYQTGAFATDTSDLVAALKAAHIDLGNKVNDPAQAQIILKDAFGQALSGMQATGLSKWTQAELFGQLKNLANPDLQPAANREIGAQTIGTLQWEQQMQKDFARYKQFSPGINDPTDFQRRWVEANPLQPFIDKARTQIGPLKGEAPDLPAGAVDTGRTYQGKPIYNVPDGKGGFKQQVLH